MAINPAKLPPELITPPRRCLRDLEVGEVAWIIWEYMAVDSEHRCFLMPETLLLNEPLSSAIRVHRTQAGFEVGIPANFTRQWEVGNRILSNYLPVVKLEREAK